MLRSLQGSDPEISKPSATSFTLSPSTSTSYASATPTSILSDLQSSRDVCFSLHDLSTDSALLDAAATVAGIEAGDVKRAAGSKTLQKLSELSEKSGFRTDKKWIDEYREVLRL